MTDTPIAPRRTIPQLRMRWLEIAAQLHDPELSIVEQFALGDEIAAMAEETKRRFGGRRAQPREPKLNPQLADEIRAYAAAHPRASYKTIANRLRCGIGRVSEALTGFRGERK